MPGVGRASMLRNNSFASLSTRGGKGAALAHARFNGRFAGQRWKHGHGGWHWRHHHPIIAIGWFGPLFWPYAYWDFIDYTFWPYAYDAFWPYAYDDFYVGVFGPYAYEGPAYVTRSGGRARTARRATTAGPVVCTEPAPALTGWPIEQISQVVQPDQTQQAALNDLKDATAKALEALQSACPDELPSTPTGRLASMRNRISTMLLAASIVQPPLQRFYDSLNDEQKARFNVISPEPRSDRAARTSARPVDLSQICSGQAVKATDVPTERVARAINPTDSQRSALNALNAATAKAAEFLKANCPEEPMHTPPARVAAMEQRLKAVLEAIKIVEPALENFYMLLTDEQKARFNLLDARQS